MRVSQQGTQTVVAVNYILSAGNHYTLTYTLSDDGRLHVAADYTPASKADTPELPRVGLRFRLPAAMDGVTYFGRGPEENYIDRNHGTPIGRYKAKANDLYYPYVRPQENGHHTDVRWLRLEDHLGNGLLVKADSVMEFNALRNSIEDFDQGKAINHHADEIRPRHFVEVCLDGFMQGIGGYDSWGVKTGSTASASGRPRLPLRLLHPARREVIASEQYDKTVKIGGFRLCSLGRFTGIA